MLSFFLYKNSEEGMRKGKGNTQKKKTLKIAPVTEDAIYTVLEQADSYTVFRKQGNTMKNEYAGTLSKMLEEMNSLEEEKENMFAREEACIRESSVISLESWAIKLAESPENGLDVILFGVIKGTGDIVQSSFLQKRESSHCVLSKNTKYLLEGALDKTIEPHPGFREETKEIFAKGFPNNWREVITEEIEHIKGQGKKKEEVKTRKRRKRRWL